ncbi:MAG: hypothetical protein ACKOI2_03255 [Actinomycetota bacterium]
MRRSIDDQQIHREDLPSGLDDAMPVSWAVAASDDYDDAIPRIILTIEDIGRPGTGLIAHLSADGARRLRQALKDALREIGESPDGRDKEFES